MTPEEQTDFVRRAHAVYQRLKPQLEQAHVNEFVAIEPVSGDYFLGQTLSDAGNLARKAHPDRLVHFMRVGHRAAVHIGTSISRTP